MSDAPKKLDLAAVRARLDGPQLRLGEEADVRLVAVDVTKRRVTFERA